MKEQHNTIAEGFPRLAANLEALLKNRHLNASKIAQILGIPGAIKSAVSEKV